MKYQYLQIIKLYIDYPTYYVTMIMICNTIQWYISGERDE